MRRLILILTVFILLIMPNQSWAQTSQYPNPYRQTTWNNITDSMHKFMGATPSQIQKMHQARTRARLHSIYAARRAKMQSGQ